MILPKNQIKQFAQMKEAFQNADNSSDNEKQKNVSEEPVGAEILRKIDAQRQMLQKRNWNDKAGFFCACIAADAETVHASGGIGTLSEKKMHSVIKYFIEPDASKHESRVGNSIVDVKNESGVFEVQTASFNVLRKKLPSLLISNCVTVVHPIPFEKHIVKLNAVTGEIGKRRKSPKRGSFFDAFFELYKLAEIIEHNNLNILLLLVDTDEYRLENAPVKKRGCRRRSTTERFERIPIALRGSILICGQQDWRMLLPTSLQTEFTSAELAAEAQIPRKTAQTALRVLSRVGAVHLTGKRGRMNLYGSKPVQMSE